MGAPEHATYVLGLMSRLSAGVRARLAFRWIDRGLRVHAATALLRTGRSAAAEKLHTLKEIRDQETCRIATDVLIELFREGGDAAGADSSAIACGVFLVTTLKDHVNANGLDIFRVLVGTVTAAACVGAGSQEAAEQVEDVTIAAMDL